MVSRQRQVPAGDGTGGPCALGALFRPLNTHTYYLLDGLQQRPELLSTAHQCRQPINRYTLSSFSRSVVSDFLRPHGLYPARLLCPWDFPGKDTGVGCHVLLQGIFPARVSCISCLGCWIHHCTTWEAPTRYTAAAAKSLQSCPTLCDPIDSSPPGSPIPGILQARTGVGCHFLLQCMKVKSEREVAQLCPTLCDPMDGSLPGSSIHGIFQARVLEWGAIAFSEPGILAL